MSAVDISGLIKAYRGTPVLSGVDMTVPEGSLTAVLGASGSGKTTLLRIIAGFEHADAGTVAIGGTPVDDGRRTVRPQHRAVGYVPQDAALFPHLSVAANIGFGLSRRSRPAALGDLLNLVGLTGLEHRAPHQLSGGQQQRVALARALAVKPQVVLLDEPFGALDAALRQTVRADVARIVRTAGATTILVTHDQDEALSIADHVVLLRDGVVLAQGSPRELYQHPPTPDVATAIGTANLLPCQVEAGALACALGGLEPSSSVRDGERRVLLLRPEQIVLVPASIGSCLMTVRQLDFQGHDTVVHLEGRGLEGLVARLRGGSDLQLGESVQVDVTAAVHSWATPSGSGEGLTVHDGGGGNVA